jgi:hypothetical protein
MLMTVVQNKVKDGDRPESHETDIREGVLKSREVGRDIVSNQIVE